MAYTQAAVERAVKVHEVFMQALSGRQPWIHVAEILGVSARTVRRLRWRYEQYGFTGFTTIGSARPRRGRCRWPKCSGCWRSTATATARATGTPGSTCGISIRSPGARTACPVSYSFVKKALPVAGLVSKRRPRGRHRRRREPRPCLRELVHLDGSRHQWLALVPETWPTLIVVVDDATKRRLYAQLVADEGGERAAVIMTALWAGLETDGIPGALYTDRAGWAG